jgi:uncharacterized membrane protein YbhN (UPF0104 family)
MHPRLRRWWPAFKTLFAVVIIVFIGRHFVRDLSSENALDALRSARPAWLLLSGALYIAGLGLSLVFWYRLLQHLGQQPEWLPAVRAYYVGHMGKYLPGKAWALMLRSGLICSSQVRIGVAVFTSFYEVLTTMTGGVLLAAVVAVIWAPTSDSSFAREPLRALISLKDPGPCIIERGPLLVLSGLLLLFVGLPILPPVYNRIVRHMSLPLRSEWRTQLPQIRWTVLMEGLVLTAVGWLILGASLWAVLRSILSEADDLTISSLGVYSGLLALAYVAGFVIVLVPSGLGIREGFLRIFLLHELVLHLGFDKSKATTFAALATVILRLVWTAAEVIIVAIVYWFPGPSVAEAKREAVNESDS